MRVSTRGRRHLGLFGIMISGVPTSEPIRVERPIGRVWVVPWRRRTMILEPAIVLGHQDVRRLQVAMDDALLVRAYAVDLQKERSVRQWTAGGVQ